VTPLAHRVPGDGKPRVRQAGNGGAVNTDAIRARLEAATPYPAVVTFAPDTPNALCTLLGHAPEDIAALLQRVAELEAQLECYSDGALDIYPSQAAKAEGERSCCNAHFYKRKRAEAEARVEELEAGLRDVAALPYTYKNHMVDACVGRARALIESPLPETEQ
jgi:BMFP domain-containing protein YqiC